MKIIKNISNIILSFILLVVILILIVFHILSSKALNKQYILNKMEETEFYLQVGREVNSGFENYIYQSGLPEDTIQDLFTDDMIKKDVNSIIDYVYEGKEITISENEVRDNLDKKINDFLTSQGKNLNKQGRENITEFENLIVSEYKENIKVSDKLYDTAQKVIKEIKTIYNKVKYLPIIIFIVVLILLVLINVKNIWLAINSISISLLSCGVLLKMAKSIVLKYVDIDNLLLFTTSLSNLMINIAKEIIFLLSDFGTWLIVIGITGIIISAILRKEEGKKIEE